MRRGGKYGQGSMGGIADAWKKVRQELSFARVCANSRFSVS
jgi:hypothetical protein